MATCAIVHFFESVGRYHHWQVASFIRKTRTCLEENENHPIPASLEQAKKPSVPRGRRSEDNNLAYSGAIREAVKPSIDVVEPDRTTFEPVDG